MNEIRNLAIAFVVGVAITFTICYTGFILPSAERIGDLTNKLDAARFSEQRLTESTLLRQTYLDRAKRAIVSSQSSIDKLREIINILRESDRTNNLSNHP